VPEKEGQKVAGCVEKHATFCRIWRKEKKTPKNIITSKKKRKTDDNGNVMFQSYLSKLLIKKPPEDTVVPPLWGTRRKNVCFSKIICSRCYT